MKKNMGLEKEGLATRKPKKEKIDFKEVVGRSRKLKQETEKINEEEKAMQVEFMEYHNSTKSFLENMKQKHGLNYSNKHKYLPKKSNNEYYLKKSNASESSPLSP